MRLWLLLVAFLLWLPTTAWLFDSKNGVSKAAKRERFLDEHLPLSGYVKARGIEVDPKHQVGEDGSWDPSLSPGESRSMVIKILKRINKPSRCSKLEISGLLSHRDAATLHSRVFTLLPDEQFNGRAAWSNGRDVLSYVYGAPANEGEAFGTWIVGDQGGIDSGFGYIKPKLPTMTPLEAHTTQGLTTSPLIQDPSLYHSSWFWLRGKDWLEATNVTLTCLDNDGADWDMHSSSPWSSFYQVQFFASDDTDALTSAFLQVSVVDGGRSGRLTFHNPDDDVGKGDKWAIGAARVIALSGVEPLCALGQPVSITLASSPHLGTAGSILPPVPKQSAPVIAHLVTDEVSGLATFRLIFRTWTIAGGPPSEFSALADPEIILEVSSSLGVLGGHFISPVSEAAAAELESTDFEKLASVQQGEYVWLWWYPSSSSTTAGGSGGSSTNCPIVAEQEADELLLVCTYRAGDVAVFRRFDTDRTVQMKQSALQRDTDLWFVRFEQGQGMSRAVHWTAQARQAGTKVSSSAPETVYVSATGTVSAPQPPLCTSDVRVTHSVVIGDVKRSVAFLRHYLEYKDSQLEGQRRSSSSAALDPSEVLSSCYFYHAAVSMPKAFIYAAEVLCVLQGAKSVAMIQYTSPTELQYKFPLVSELSRGVATAVALAESTPSTPLPSLDLAMTITRYRSDETLIVYRKPFLFLVNALLPVHKAQALHPIPYPNTDTTSAFGEEAACSGMYSPREIDNEYKKTGVRHRRTESPSASRATEQADLEWAWSRQIFFSWWNGYVLGYPQHFINSYCETFHNGLELEEKRQWSAIARRHVEKFFRRENLSRPFIRAGLVEPLAPEWMDRILDAGLG